MGGFFGAASKGACRNELFYGVDYNSHLGTRRAGMATYDADDNRFCRSIHSIENTYFRTKFEDELDKFKGNIGIGVISDNDPQPIVFNSHLGKFAIVTVAKICNIERLEKELLEEGAHFGELSSGRTNPTELIALLISMSWLTRLTISVASHASVLPLRLVLRRSAMPTWQCSMPLRIKSAKRIISAPSM